MFELLGSAGALPAQAGWSLGTNADALSVLVGGLVSLVTPGIRYRYSTEYALFYILTVMVLALSPFTTLVFGLEPWYFLGGFAVGQTLAILGDYSYRVITGVAAFRDVAGA